MLSKINESLFVPAHQIIGSMMIFGSLKMISDVDSLSFNFFVLVILIFFGSFYFIKGCLLPFFPRKISLPETEFHIIVQNEVMLDQIELLMIKCELFEFIEEIEELDQAS